VVVLRSVGRNGLDLTNGAIKSAAVLLKPACREKLLTGRMEPLETESRSSCAISMYPFLSKSRMRGASSAGGTRWYCRLHFPAQQRSHPQRVPPGRVNRLLRAHAMAAHEAQRNNRVPRNQTPLVGSPADPEVSHSSSQSSMNSHLQAIHDDRQSKTPLILRENCQYDFGD
jgi:hypothetical protein